MLLGFRSSRMENLLCNFSKFISSSLNSISPIVLMSNCGTSISSNLALEKIDNSEYSVRSVGTFSSLSVTSLWYFCFKCVIFVLYFSFSLFFFSLASLFKWFITLLNLRDFSPSNFSTRSFLNLAFTLPRSLLHICSSASFALMAGFDTLLYIVLFLVLIDFNLLVNSRPNSSRSANARSCLIMFFIKVNLASLLATSCQIFTSSPSSRPLKSSLRVV